jgi:acyl carrier protein
MELHEVFFLFEDVLEQPRGTLTGEEKLENLENWNSLAVVTLIALAEERGLTLTGDQILDCATAADLARLFAVQPR